MSAKHLMIAINWYGPYPDLNEARKHARHDYVHGLYLAIGKYKYERRRALQYIGIGNSMHTVLTSRHHKLSLIVRERTLWLGEIVTAEPSGKRLKPPAPRLISRNGSMRAFSACRLTTRRPRRCRLAA